MVRCDGRAAECMQWENISNNAKSFLRNGNLETSQNFTCAACCEYLFTCAACAGGCDRSRHTNSTRTRHRTE